MTNDVHSHDVNPEDLTLYVLGALDGSELARIGKHVEGCSSCRMEVQKINADLGAFAMASAPSSAPPSRARERLLTEIARARMQQSGVRVRGWSFELRAAIAIILLVAVVFQWRNVATLRRENAELKHQLAQEQKASAQARMIADTIMAPDAMKLTLVAAKAPSQPVARVFCSEKKGRVFLMANNLAPLGPGKTYELWMLPKSGAPVPAGMFQADDGWNAQMLHEGLPAGMEAKGFAVTIEPEQGSAAPTKPPFLIGTVS